MGAFLISSVRLGTHILHGHVLSGALWSSQRSIQLLVSMCIDIGVCGRQAGLDELSATCAFVCICTYPPMLYMLGGGWLKYSKQIM